jgi:hypothetical protein
VEDVFVRKHELLDGDILFFISLAEDDNFFRKNVQLLEDDDRFRIVFANPEWIFLVVDSASEPLR